MTSRLPMQVVVVDGESESEGDSNERWRNWTDQHQLCSEVRLFLDRRRGPARRRRRRRRRRVAVIYAVVVVVGVGVGIRVGRGARWCVVVRGGCVCGWLWKMVGK